MNHESNLDSIDAINARYRATLLNHPVHHAVSTVDGALLFPPHRKVEADHGFHGEHGIHLKDYLGSDVKTALHIFYRDMAEQLNKIRAATFTRDHLVYSAAGFPEHDALNPAGKPALVALTHLVKEASSLLETGKDAAASFTDAAVRERQIKELSGALADLHARYENALNIPHEDGAARNELVTYSRDLVGGMQQVIAAALGTGKGRGA